MEKFHIKFSEQVKFQKGKKKTLLVNLENKKNMFVSNEVIGYINEAEKEKLNTEEFLDVFEDIHDQKYMKKVIKYIDECGMWEERKIPFNSKVVNFSLDITNQCNLRCKHCCVSAGENLYGEDLTTEQLKKVLNKIYEYQPRMISISGGEPLVRKDFVEIIEDIKLHYNGPLDLMTNATLIDDKMAKFITQNFISVSISLDGVDDETTSIIRGKGVFAETVHGIKLLKKYGMKNIESSMVVCKENEQYISKFQKLCKDLEVNSKLRILEPGGRIDRFDDEVHYVDSEINPEGKELEIYLKKCLNYGINKLHPDTCACQAARREFLIDFKGDIYPCASLTDAELKMGNILDVEDVTDYFNNQRFHESKGYKEFARYLPYQVEGCKDCNKNLLCFSCVRTVKDRVAAGTLHKDCKFNHKYYDLYWEE